MLLGFLVPGFFVCDGMQLSCTDGEVRNAFRFEDHARAFATSFFQSTIRGVSTGLLSLLGRVAVLVSEVWSGGAVLTTSWGVSGDPQDSTT
jgi:hypothetical protein